ncbi:hypothetical protein [Cellulomonas sp. KH9]|uniref:hypothetical protein n=1 Tax=Cellulomonas sp. KH9 TaxID=1855324 RepID=UPI0008EA94EB|nr:hypothetical protein [Cellulomonas sp. KH9]SFK11846.1 hypothetical protein SAMN05216467_2026 [Cellulomonas sp. KH9]SFK56938.1 hypothetical protein SAMN05216467_3820 [Cellulomonas sp. KH9]
MLVNTGLPAALRILVQTAAASIRTLMGLPDRWVDGDLPLGHQALIGTVVQAPASLDATAHVPPSARRGPGCPIPTVESSHSGFDERAPR